MPGPLAKILEVYAALGLGMKEEGKIGGEEVEFWPRTGEYHPGSWKV